VQNYIAGDFGIGSILSVFCRSMLRMLGYLLLVLGVLAIIISYWFRTEQRAGADLISALAPLLAGLGALLIMLYKRRGKRF
jgi:hypothetical protein